MIVTSQITTGGITYSDVQIAKANFCSNVGLVGLDGEKYVVRFRDVQGWVATRRFFEWLNVGSW